MVYYTFSDCDYSTFQGKRMECTDGATFKRSVLKCLHSKEPAILQVNSKQSETFVESFLDYFEADVLLVYSFDSVCDLVAVRSVRHSSAQHRKSHPAWSCHPELMPIHMKDRRLSKALD